MAILYVLCVLKCTYKKRLLPHGKCIFSRYLHFTWKRSFLPTSWCYYTNILTTHKPTQTFLKYMFKQLSRGTLSKSKFYSIHKTFLACKTKQNSCYVKCMRVAWFEKGERNKILLRAFKIFVWEKREYTLINTWIKHKIA